MGGANQTEVAFLQFAGRSSLTKTTTSFSTMPTFTLRPLPCRSMARESLQEEEPGQKLQMVPVHVRVMPWHRCLGKDGRTAALANGDAAALLD